jgi:hypothetical protein
MDYGDPIKSMKIVENEGLTYDIIIEKNLSRFNTEIRSIFAFEKEITKENNIFKSLREEN